MTDRLTGNQAALLQLALVDGRVTSRDSITIGCGPATPGLLANKGLLRGLGLDGPTQSQLYEITAQGRAWLAENAS